MSVYRENTDKVKGITKVFDMDGDALDGLDMAQLEALSAQIRGDRGPKVRPGGVSRKKLGSTKKVKPRALFGRDEVDNINETVDIVISLPLHMVVGMEQNEGSYREAVRDYLRLKGWGEWADSRFVVSVRGDRMAARDRFTRRMR